MQNGYFYLVLIAMANVVISLYYYASMVKAVYLLEPDEPLPRITLSTPDRLLATAVVIVLVVGGILPHYLYALASAMVRQIA